MGAGRCVGIDNCEAAILAARQLANDLQLKSEFIHTCVYDLPRDFDSVADIALISVGTLTWLPDLERFFQIVQGTLRSSGVCVVYEQHPFCFVLDDKGQVDGDYAYFDPGPYCDVGDLDYFGKEPYGKCEAYSFNHTMSALINSLVVNGLQIERLEEFPEDNANWLKDDSANPGVLPFTCLCVSRKNSHLGSEKTPHSQR